jgi:hypothetical protein
MRRLFILVLFVLPTLLFGQTLPDSVTFLASDNIPNRAGYTFDKQSNTSSFQSDVAFHLHTTDIQAQLFDSYQSTAILASDKNLRETHKLRFGLGYQTAGLYSFGVLTEYLNFNDSRTTAVNSSNRNSAGVFAKYAASDSAFLVAMAGATQNTQIGVKDKGILYDLEGSLKSYPMVEMLFSGGFHVHDEHISPRYNKGKNFSFGLETPDDSPVRNTLRVLYDDQRTDFYVLADSITAGVFKTERNIQQRMETNYGIEDRLENLPLLSNLTALLSMSYYLKQVDRDYYYTPLSQFSQAVLPEKINETRIEAQSELAYTSQSFDSRFKILFQERDEKRSIPSQQQLPQLPSDPIHNTIYLDLLLGEEKMNNTSKRVSLSWNNEYRLTKAQSLIVSLSHTKLRYDTPSLQNDDDRDELLSIGRLLYRNQLFPYFTITGMLEGSMSHLVYIAASRSSNNDKNKILRMQIAGDYRADNVHNMATFDILSNYTIYDYEDITQTIRSFSFRQFQASDSLFISVARNLFVKGAASIKLSEQGSLNWGQFTVIPVRENHEQFAHVQLGTSWAQVSYAIGIRYFKVVTYAFKGRGKSLDYSYRSLGPSVEITSKIREMLQFRLTGWYDFIDRLNASPLTQSTLQLQCLINF